MYNHDTISTSSISASHISIPTNYHLGLVSHDLDPGTKNFDKRKTKINKQIKINTAARETVFKSASKTTGVYSRMNFGSLRVSLIEQ